MARVTIQEVKDIIKLEADITDANVTACITAANLMINAVITSTDVSADQKKEIERWLSAHFCAINDLRLAAQEALEASEKYQYKVDLGLYVTMYGQTAMRMDTSGALAQLDKAQKEGKTAGSLTVLNPISSVYQ